MSLGEILTQGLTTLVIGMGTVFVALVLLIGLSGLISYFFRADKPLKAKTKIIAEPDAPTAIIEIPAASAVQTADEGGAVVAAISAALSVVLDKSRGQFKVKSIARVNTNAPRRSAWATAGRNEHIYNRF